MQQAAAYALALMCSAHGDLDNYAIKKILVHRVGRAIEPCVYKAKGFLRYARRQE
jgi:hypothetical protein